jgi:hypothetical protein
MKKYLRFFTLFFIAKFSAQDYVPLLQEGNKWYEYEQTYVGSYQVGERSYIFINGEETKNGIVYKKIFYNLYCTAFFTSDYCLPTGNADVFYKLMREDINERKVYYYDEDEDKDVLLYNFSLNVGDLIPLNFPFRGRFPADDYGAVPTVLNIFENGKAYGKTISKTFVILEDAANFAPGAKIYEGIGSNIGLLYKPGYYLTFEGGHLLECFENTASGKSCDANFLGLKENTESKSFSLVYKKDKNNFQIVGKSSEKFQIIFYDYSGRLLESKYVTSNEDFYLNNITRKKMLLYKMLSSRITKTGKLILP